jgi:acetyl-CoA acetyltransferase
MPMRWRLPSASRRCITRTSLAAAGGYGGAHPLAPSDGRTKPYGIGAPAHNFALMMRRHMHLYGTTHEHLGHQVITTREHAMRNPRALYRTPLTMDDYLNSRMIVDPFRLFDCTLESDGAGAVIVVSAERARDFPHPPAYIMAVSQGEHGSTAAFSHQQPDELYTTAGHSLVAERLYAMAGVGPRDIDVAELYDHFSGMVLLTLEDYGFCGRGESGPFVAEGRTKWAGGELPVNTNGGNLSCMYMPGMTLVIEGVEQVRGTSTAQVENAELCLVTAGPGTFPTSAMILRR